MHISRDVAGTGAMDICHLRECRLPSVGLDFPKVLKILPLKIITLFMCLRIKGLPKEL